MKSSNDTPVTKERKMTLTHFAFEDKASNRHYLLHWQRETEGD